MGYGLLSCAGASRRENSSAIGAGVGAGMGAILGQAIGRSTEGTLIGAGIGAMAGSIAGDQVGGYIDRQEQKLEDALATSQAAGIERTRQAVAAAETAGEQRTRDLLTATFNAGVLFDYDSTTLKPGAYPELKRVIAVLNRYPDTHITVAGHTDAKGSEAYNQQLSEKRAEAVRKALIEMNIAPERIRAVGYGESQPISSDDAANRRVDIVIEPAIHAQG